MPLNIDFLQVLLHMLNFVILAGGLSLLLFKPISKFLDQRRAHFGGGKRPQGPGKRTAEGGI